MLLFFLKLFLETFKKFGTLNRSYHRVRKAREKFFVRVFVVGFWTSFAKIVKKLGPDFKILEIQESGNNYVSVE